MESELITRVITKGDHIAFTALVRIHQSSVRNFLRRLTNGDHALADDISQETFLKAFNNIKRFSFKGKFISWLFQIAYRQFITALRQNKKYSNDVPLLDETLSQTDFKPDNLVTSMALNKCISQLPVSERSLLILNYQFGMTHNEISVIMQIPLGTVKSSVRRGKQKLLEMMTSDNDHNKPVEYRVNG